MTEKKSSRARARERKKLDAAGHIVRGAVDAEDLAVERLRTWLQEHECAECASGGVCRQVLMVGLVVVPLLSQVRGTTDAWWSALSEVAALAPVSATAAGDAKTRLLRVALDAAVDSPALSREQREAVQAARATLGPSQSKLEKRLEGDWSDDFAAVAELASSLTKRRFGVDAKRRGSRFYERAERYRLAWSELRRVGFSSRVAAHLLNVSESAALKWPRPRVYGEPGAAKALAEFGRIGRLLRATFAKRPPELGEMTVADALDAFGKSSDNISISTDLGSRDHTADMSSDVQRKIRMVVEEAGTLGAAAKVLRIHREQLGAILAGETNVRAGTLAIAEQRLAEYFAKRTNGEGPRDGR